MSQSSSVQFSSVAQSCLTLCDHMNCSMIGLPVPHYLVEFAQVYSHCILIYLGLIWRPQYLFTHASGSLLVPSPCHTHHQAQISLKNSGHESQNCHKLNPHISGCQSSTSVQFSSGQFSLSVVSDSLRPHELQHASLPCPSPTPGVHSNSRPSTL